MKHTKLLSIVEDILNEEKHIWDAPKVYRNAADATKELKKFPPQLRKFFEVAPDDTRPAGILATGIFYKRAQVVDDNVDYITYEFGGFEIGLEDDRFPDYIAKFRKEKWYE